MKIMARTDKSLDAKISLFYDFSESKAYKIFLF